MFAAVLSPGIIGLDTFRVDTEIHISRGLPSFQIVGLPDQQVKEARERVRAAVLNSGFEFPSRRLIANLAPAGVKKTGACYDLPIALGIIAAYQRLPLDRLAATMVVGELALDGAVRPVTGILPIVEFARNHNLNVMVPEANRREALLIAGVTIVGMKTLFEAVAFLKGEFSGHCDPLSPLPASEEADTGPDFAAIVGHQMAKRALEISAAGRHNLLFVGSPGVGKSLLSQSIVTILPAMTVDESLAITKIYSIAGLLPHDAPLIKRRVFRNPHHTISFAGMIGGGSDILPGEVSLAHHGVLFLDELPEFQRRTLEVLRQPMENCEVLISRAGRTVMYPADFLLLAAMNPCPCGYFGDSKKKCSCNPFAIDRYISRISGPLLERIDLQIEVTRTPLESDTAGLETSAAVKARVQSAWSRQMRRNQVKWNSRLSRQEALERFRIQKSALSLLNKISAEMNLSMRSYLKIIRISRTIADLEDQDQVAETQVLEASGYRLLERHLWKF